MPSPTDVPVSPPAQVELDVHTEHCCVVHGCKYGDDDCPVTTRQKPQSFPCEDCHGEMPAAAEGDLSSRLRIIADGDLRVYARDSLMGIHPDQGELREWADLMDGAADEIQRLRKGVEGYLAGDYPNPRTHRPRTCPHGEPYWQECHACNDAALAAILKPSA